MQSTIPRRPTRRSDRAGSALILLLLVGPFTTVLYGAALAKLWEWFVTDTFGVLAISTAQAIGLALVVGFATYQSDAKNNDNFETDHLANCISRLFESVMRTGMALL